MARKIEPSKVKVGKGKLNEQSLQIVSGIVKAYFPKIGLYNVSLKGQIAKCYSLNYSGGMGMGLYAKGTYSPGESVFCIYNEPRGEGYIIGALPQMFVGNNIAYPTSGESTFGLNPDGSSRKGLVAGPLSGCTKNDTKGIEVVTDSHCGVHDLMPGGSFSMSSETGIRFFADPYSIGMQCDDATGLWIYSDDSYMRQSSINLQQIAGGKVEEDYNDNGELIETVGHSMFSWELLGQTEKPTEDTIKFNPGVVDGHPLGSPYTLDPNAKPFHRVVEYGGYLGHGYQRVVNAPPVRKTDSYNYGSSDNDQYCLSRIAQFVDGDVSIESAKSIILTKHCFIPSIQTMQVPDDLNGGAGDSPKEFKGEYDFSHEDIEVQGSPEFNLGTTDSEILQELAALMDYQVYLLNYKLVHPFVYHKKDYFVSDTEDLDGYFPYPLYKDWFTALKTQQFADTPLSLELDIHEKLKSTYYASESGLALLPEGGVSLYGGYGEEVRMGAGTSVFSAPGDIWLKAGRNIHLWAGGDIILKAKNCIDSSATDGSIRVKAEKHLELLGGNARTSGGVLIESRSDSSNDFNFSESGEKIQVGGLVIRATNGTAAFEGKDTYIRSGVGDFMGNMTIDAGAGSFGGQLNLRGANINNYISAGYSIANGTFDSSTDASIASIIEVIPGKSIEAPGLLDMSLNVRTMGSIITNGSIMCGSNIVAKNTYSSLAKQITIAPIDDKDASGYVQRFEEIKEDLTKRVDTANVRYRKVSEDIYDENKIGSDKCLKEAGFSYRTEEEYGAGDFKLYADRWQNIAYTTDIENEGLSLWKETEVSTSKKTGQYPYPGDAFYTDNDKTCLVYQVVNLYNDEMSYTNSRCDSDGNPVVDYTEPKYREPITESLNYYIIVGGANG